MDKVPSRESAGGTRLPRNSRPKPAAATTLKIRYGRCAIALIGLMALLVAGVSGVLRLFSIGPVWLPMSSVAATVMAVAMLRWLAVRDRRAKVQAAFKSAMGPQGPGRSTATGGSGKQHLTGQGTEPESARTPERPAADVPLFDAEAARPTVKPLTAAELRQAALAEAAASGDHSVRSAAADALESGSDAGWEPVEVPKPTYVDAAKAERAAPEPLQLPESPKAVGKPSLKQGPVAPPNAAAPQPRPLTKTQSALSNLDDVLQRRRA